jgi:hypothetical protein
MEDSADVGVSFDDIDSIAAGEIDVVDNSGEVVEEAPFQSEETNEVSEHEPTYKVLVDGSEQVVTQSELLKNYQTMKASQERFQQAAKLNRSTLAEKQKALDLKQRWEKMKAAGVKNPRNLFKELGLDAEKFAYELVNEKIDQEMMTPEQREASATQRKLAEAEQKLIDHQRHQEDAEVNRLKGHYKDKFASEITKELTTQGMPVTRDTIKEVATVLKRNLLNKSEIPISSIVSALKPGYETRVASYLHSLAPEDSSRLLGDKFLSRMRSNDLKRVKNPTRTNSSAPTKSRQRKAETKRITQDEFDAYLDNIIES